MTEATENRILKSPWWGVVALAFAIGGWAASSAATNARQDRQIGRKADSSSVATELRAIHAAVDSMNARQTQFFCEGKPRFCR